MKSIYLLGFLLMLSGFWACKNDAGSDKNSQQETTTSTQPRDCKYSVQEEKILLRWTAFKTTERIGVSGTFNEIEVNAPKAAPSLPILIQGTSFRLNSKTVNSGNEARDVKLVNFFFGKLSGNYSIFGSVKSVEGNEKAGRGIFLINMNGVSQEAAFEYYMEGKTLVISTTIDTNQWEAAPAIASINKACEEKHTGKDGVSKTWPDVKIDLRVPLDIVCR